MLPRVAGAALILIACSRTGLDGGPDDTVVARTASCAKAIVPGCRGLRALAVDQPLDGALQVHTLVGRDDSFDAFSETGFVRSLVVAGGALHLGAGRALSFSGTDGDDVWTAVASGSHDFVFIDGPGPSSLRAFDSTYQPTATVKLEAASTHTGHLASFDDLVLVQYERDHDEAPRVAVLDAAGAVVREEPLATDELLAETWGFPGAYGCGFFYSAAHATSIRTSKVTVLPVDGRPEATIALPTEEASLPDSFPSFAAWPYDARAIVMTWVESEDGGECRTRVHVARDDASVLVDESLASACYAPAMTFAPPARTRVLPTSFGAVLRLPDWSLQLLDPSGKPLGAPVAVTVSDGSKEYEMFEAAAGPYAVVLTTALDAAVPHATLVTCE